MTRLDILSDPICPWCYIGKALLERALERAPAQDFELEWHPFQLNPEMPREGRKRRAYLEGKFGGQKPADAFYGRIAEAARAAGLEIDFSRIERTPNTLDAHRLIHWAGLEGRQNAVVSALFAAYFSEGRDIGAPETLAGIAASCGLDGAMVRTLLAGDADVADIRARDAHARERGVSGVPTFVVANRYVLTGAQPGETWEKVIAEITRAQQAEGPR